MTLVSRYRSNITDLIDQWVPQGAASRAALRLGGGTALAQALVVLSAPLLTRLYSPTEMGQFGVLLSFVGFATVGVSLRYDMAIVPARTDAEADQLLIIASAVSVPTTIIASLLMLVLIEKRLLSFGSLPATAVLGAFAIMLSTSVFAAVRFWAIRRHEFGVVARAAVAQGVGRAGLPVISGLLGAGWWGLMLGELAGRVFGIGRLLQLAASPVKDIVRRSTRDAFQRTAEFNWRYPVIVAPSALLDALGGALALPLVAGAFGAPAAGQLLIVQRLAGVPASLIGASVADVFHARVSTLFRDDPTQVRRTVLRTVARLVLIAAAIYIPVGIVGIWGFAKIFGEEWREAGYLVALFTPLSIATLAVSPVTRLYAVVNRPELKLLFDVGLIIVPIMSFVVLHRQGLSYWRCMIVYVTLGTIAFALHLALTLWAAGLTPREREMRVESTTDL
ncbi:MAG: oligosaccharide flippase family protein [bacterium]